MSTAALLASVRALPIDDLPVATARVARHCVLDWLGCALAGSSDALVDLLAEEVLGFTSDGEATVIGRSCSATPSMAALVNGTAGHALDYDDTHMAMTGHPTAPVLPAVLALGQRLGASGSDVLRAFVVGVETECRLGLLMPGHYEAGWHSTATLGTLAAAAGCAHLLDLDDDRTAHALGLAATQAAGLKVVFGTMAKPLHAGKAAMNGLLSAGLAARGFTAGTDVLGAPSGFADTHGGGAPDAAAMAAADGRFLIGETLFKYHASCYLTHAAVEAALVLRGQGVQPADIVGLDVEVHRSCMNVCAIAEPTTGLQGKFSLRATTAMALLGDDTADVATYSDERMTATDLVALRDRVKVLPTGKAPNTMATVTARTSDGQAHVSVADSGVPMTDLAQQEKRLTAKFLALATPVLGAQRAGAVVDLVERLGEIGVSELLASVARRRP